MPPSQPRAEGLVTEGAILGSVPPRHLLRREVVEGYQRDRVVEAVAELAHEGSVPALTTSGIIRRARMSRKTFYELFASKANGLEFACESAADRLSEPVTAAAAAAGPGLERLDRAVGALLEATAENPLLAELCLIHSPAISAWESEIAGETVVETLAEAMTGGRETGRGARGEGRRKPPAELERFVAAAIVFIVATRLRRGEAEELTGLREELTGFAAKLFGADGAGARRTRLSNEATVASCTAAVASAKPSARLTPKPRFFAN